MQVEEIMSQARESLGSKRVFGEPYEKNGVTIIPAARVMGGAGGGDSGEKSGEGGSTDATRAAGVGAGYGMVGSPAGAFVIKGDQVRWMPAIDVNRLMFGMQIVLIVFFLVIRSIANARAATPRA
jgi:uncharacterized spore protein YtfJ